MAYQNNKGFTLIELLVGISISTILMISIGYLITGGIKNITSQEKILQNREDFSSFQSKLNTIFSSIDTNYPAILTNSGVILKIKQNYDEGGIVYIGETIQDEFYCLSGSEDTKTNHIFIKTFIPGFDIDTQKAHKIDLVGKGFFGYNQIPKDGLEPDKVFLNNPTGEISSGSINFYSDTLNNRILYKSGSKVYELLNREDGLSEPTDLKIINGELYIANSGKGEILKLSSKNISTPDLTLTGVTANDSSFEIGFYNQNGNKNLNSLNTTSDFTFSSYLKQSGDSVTKNNNKLTYSFSGGISQNFNNETITISNLSDFSGTGTYFVKLTMGSFEKYYKYFVQADDNLLTKNDNTLEIIEIKNKYPIKINSSSNFEYFLEQGHSNMNYNLKYDYILRNPIKSLNINFDNSKKILSFKLDYYNIYNCYNLVEKASQTLILKKNYK